MLEVFLSPLSHTPMAIPRWRLLDFVLGPDTIQTRAHECRVSRFEARLPIRPHDSCPRPLEVLDHTSFYTLHEHVRPLELHSTISSRSFLASKLEPGTERRGGCDAGEVITSYPNHFRS
ncbi:hypothetical protein BKA70DRAFT_1403007 [Coprinopsis sp. MPI-PUGE-AT-0042]|nr:hypothetical protein BKA70DRAFT_1403007 [Coprinopsis sp. MPI-PUGE-AT-0042]